MRRRPIGQILVEKNEISEAELAAALAEQERTGLRLGQILIETGRISWLALARAIAEPGAPAGVAPAGGIAERALDIGAPAEPAPEPPADATPPPPPAEQPAAAPPPLPAVPVPPAPTPVLATFAPVRAPDPAPAPPVAAPEPPAPGPAPALAPPAAAAEPALIYDPEIKLHSVEALLKERQRAFIELVTTTETLRMKVARLEEIIEERDRELAKLRIARAV